jgi:hypothetical protein
LNVHLQGFLAYLGYVGLVVVVAELLRALLGV